MKKVCAGIPLTDEVKLVEKKLTQGGKGVMKKVCAGIPLTDEVKLVEKKLTQGGKCCRGHV